MSDVTETDVGAAAGRKGLPKVALIGGAAVALLAIAGGGGWFLVQSGMFGGDPATDVAAVAPVAFYDLPDIIVNLNTGGGPTEYLKLRVALEVRDEAMIGLIEPRMARVLDAFQVYLRELRRSDIEGSAGIYRLKEELQRRVNLAVYPASVDNILFKEILIQ
ncbi:MAG TPA: flagellar basal body-associated FliL family protein [Pelagibacterium sp.]|uniref:flagellar basal body-associated FliL family protein n=1 Tax=Pelagibacterium sp. TaxID=1967288 RepID=UPI002C7C1526|nr:flagellar basal body-associated FliL family protein [Pelagibacterium sp.]HWJ87539.1 flagellar basal body-associated FliL family protein [Pelagibacterium sp.]